MSIRRASICALALTVSAVASPFARADTVNMAFNQTGKGANVQVSFFNEAPKNTFAGQLLHTITSATGNAQSLVGQHRSFCADYQQGVATSSSLFDVVATQDLDVRGTPMGLSTAAALENVFAAHGAAASASNANNNFAAAFQMVIWDVLYDYNVSLPGNGIGLDSGNIRFAATNGNALSNGILSAYNQIVASIGASASSGFMYAFENSSRQDQLLYSPSPIPTPGAAALGLLGAAVMTRRRRRPSSPT